MTTYDELVARGLIAQVTDEEEIKEYLAGNLCRRAAKKQTANRRCGTANG